jgi:hypothetical protein
VASIANLRHFELFLNAKSWTIFLSSFGVKYVIVKQVKIDFPPSLIIRHLDFQPNIIDIVGRLQNCAGLENPFIFIAKKPKKKWTPTPYAICPPFCSANKISFTIFIQQLSEK